LLAWHVHRSFEVSGGFAIWHDDFVGTKNLLARSAQRPTDESFVFNLTEFLSIWGSHFPGSWTHDGKLAAFFDLQKTVLTLGHDVLFLHMELSGETDCSAI
jgi:hypothetical protein